MGYPDLEAFAYTFGRAELQVSRRTLTAISNVSFDQPTTEGAVMGTKPYPIARTEGEMGLGAGTFTFSDEKERIAFIKALGDGFRNKIWDLTWTLTAQGAPTVTLACFGCRVLANPVAHGQGAEALTGDIGFSFMYHEIDGMRPHAS